MKLVMALIIVVVGLALTTTAEATSTTTVHTTFVGNGCGATGLDCRTGGGGSCLCTVALWNFAGRTNISSLGSLVFAASYSDGYFCSAIGSTSCLVPLTYERSLTLTFTTPSGGDLVLDENFSSGMRPLLLSQGDNPINGVWIVDPALSTGRFTRYAGSGTYNLYYVSHYMYATFIVALDGSLTAPRSD